MMDKDIRLDGHWEPGFTWSPYAYDTSGGDGGTAGNQGMVLNLALSYGGRDEIVMAASIGQRRPGRKDRRRRLPKNSVNAISTRAASRSGPADQDGGEYRVSNFLLWQLAYTEFYLPTSSGPISENAISWRRLSTIKSGSAVWAKRASSSGRT